MGRQDKNSTQLVQDQDNSSIPPPTTNTTRKLMRIKAGGRLVLRAGALKKSAEEKRQVHEEEKLVQHQISRTTTTDYRHAALTTRLPVQGEDRILTRAFVSPEATIEICTTSDWASLSTNVNVGCTVGTNQSTDAVKRLTNPLPKSSSFL